MPEASAAKGQNCRLTRAVRGTVAEDGRRDIGSAGLVGAVTDAVAKLRLAAETFWAIWATEIRLSLGDHVVDARLLEYSVSTGRQ